MSAAHPFAVTDLEFARPVTSRDDGRTHMSYILLFTCAATRTLHLEGMSDMLTGSFLLAFQRFVARRGLCTTICSDNTETFHRACGELEKIRTMLQAQKALNYLLHGRIKLKFVAEHAA